MKATGRMGRGHSLAVVRTCENEWSDYRTFTPTETPLAGTSSTKVLPSPEPPVVLTDQTFDSYDLTPRLEVRE